MEFIDFGAMIPVVAILCTLGFGFIWLRYHELKLASRRMEHDAGLNALEKRELEQRLAVLEQIVTDSGVQTATQIEALRDRPRRMSRKVVAKEIEALTIDNGGNA